MIKQIHSKGLPGITTGNTNEICIAKQLKMSPDPGPHEPTTLVPPCHKGI